MTKPFVVESDASKYASGAVLRQQDNNGDWHPCAYLSKSFSPTERNYEIYDRELLAIIRSLTDWRHYLIGSPHKVTVLSDHQNLTYFKTAQKLNRQQARWSLFLSEYNLQLVHVDRFVLSLGPETTHFRILIIHNASQSYTEHRPKSTERTDHSPRTYRYSPNR